LPDRGYAAIVYLRVANNNTIDTHLLTAKSKVAPVKQISLPRLELCTTSLLVSLACHVRATLSLSDAPVHL